MAGVMVGGGAYNYDAITGKYTLKPEYQRPAAQQAATAATNTQPTQASLPQNQQINIPQLPAPKNLVATGVTLSPSGYSASYGTPPAPERDPINDHSAVTRIDADAAREQDQRRTQMTTQSRNEAVQAFQTQAAAINAAPMPGVTGPSEDDVAQMRALEYGKAHDTIGRQKVGALAALREHLAGSGMQGSSIEAAAAGDVIGAGEQEMGDVVLAQAQGGVQRANELGDRRANTEEERRKAALSALSSIFASHGSLY